VGKKDREDGPTIVGFPINPFGFGGGGYGGNFIRPLMMTPEAHHRRFPRIRKVAKWTVVTALATTLGGGGLYVYENHDKLRQNLTLNTPPSPIDSPLVMRSLVKTEKGLEAKGPKVSKIAQFVLDPESLKPFGKDGYGVRVIFKPDSEKVALVFPPDPKTGERECARNVMLFNSCLAGSGIPAYKKACTLGWRRATDEVQDHAGYFVKNKTSPEAAGITVEDLLGTENKYDRGVYNADKKDNPNITNILLYYTVETNKKDKNNDPITQDYILECTRLKK